jgi:hypothetical protein
MAVVKNISLDGDADRDILRWLDDQRNQSAAVREAIRYYIAREGSNVTLADVLAEIRSLPSRLKVVAAVTGEEIGNTEEEEMEPLEAATNLDGLLDRLADGVIE